MTRSLNFQQIQVFKAVMETGATTKAAVALNTTQPSISRRLAELQKAAGFQLFERHSGRLRPTREGRQLYESVRRHFEGLEKIETTVRTLRKSGAGILRVGCTPTLALGLLPATVEEFMRAHPGSFISLQALGTPQLQEYLRHELLDLVVTTGTIDPAIASSTPILTADAVCIVPGKHPLAEVEWVDIEALFPYPLVLLNDTDDIMISIRKMVRDKRFPEDVAVETNSSITICSLVAAGVGVGIVNPFVADTFNDRLLIKELRPKIGVTVSIAHPTSLAQSLLATRFAAILERSIATTRPSRSAHTF